MNFYDGMKKELNNEKTLTTNGAVAYKTSGKNLLDFNFALSSMRSMDESDIKDEFAKVYFENPLIAVKYLFYVGDIREGVGERKVFRACLAWLADQKPDVVKKLIKFVSEYNRWDSLYTLENTPVWKDTARLMLNQALEDVRNAKEGKSVSLLSKWLPSENTSSKNTRRLARKTMDEWGIQPRQYRKLLTGLRTYLDVVEQKMSCGNWSDIDYAKVPSKANLNYKDAFARHDQARRQEYIDSLVKGDTKINAKALQPHEIVKQYIGGRCYWERDNVKEDPVLEELWKSQKNIMLSDALVVRDGSGSMESNCGSYRPIDVTTALAIYMADHNSKAWRGRFITFSANPKFIDLRNCKTLADKVAKTYAEDECSNTDIYKTMKLILNTAIENHMTQDDMPKMIVICSDMQWDGRSHWTSFGYNKTLFEEISDEYQSHGYKLPKIVFWNLSLNMDKTIPMQENDLGMVLCSGFSVNLLKMFMTAKIDPYEALLNELNTDRYKPIEDAVKDIV